MSGMPVCRTRCQDHLGKWHDSEKDMAKAWGITQATYRGRKRAGMSMKDRLTLKSVPGRRGFDKVKDHLGNEFDTEKDMAEAWGISEGSYRHRKNRGWDLEKNLTTTSKSSDTSCVDHIGKKYKSQKEMAKSYGISYAAYRGRKRDGWDLERILTTPEIPVANAIPVIDHLGIKHESITACAKAHGMSVGGMSQRLIRGESTKRRDKVVDHKGNEFDTIIDMCAYHGMSVGQYTKKLKEGKSLEEALTFENEYTDYLGKVHKNLTACAKAYGLKYSTVTGRRQRGWTDREMLVTPMGTGPNNLIIPEINDNSLNPKISIHEYSHTAEGTNDRIFRVTIIETGEEKYMNEEQIKKYPEGWA